MGCPGKTSCTFVCNELTVANNLSLPSESMDLPCRRICMARRWRQKHARRVSSRLCYHRSKSINDISGCIPAIPKARTPMLHCLTGHGTALAAHS